MNIIYLIDFNCPYSYIGLERLKKCCEKLNIDAEWEMKAFELEPSAGKRPEKSTAERYGEKYELSPEDASRKISEIEHIALSDGLKINYRNMPLTSSKDALRLCKFCQNKHPEITLKLVEEIFYARLVENENIADIKVLSKIAVSCGLEENEANKILENNYYNIETYLDAEEALSHGITATPCFILNHKGERLIIPGVFSAEEFEIALKDLQSGEINKKTFV
jgi:predicted DsbA family dithiol-disulfide isomerase